ncbi:MAG: hypothetical protein ABIC95_00120 [archaeon]
MHERTHELVKPYHKFWEQHGVLFVQHPEDFTPHAYWARKKKIDGGRVPKPMALEDNYFEKDFEDAIAGDDPTLFIRFHGTEPTERTWPTYEYRLDVVLSQKHQSLPMTTCSRSFSRKQEQSQSILSTQEIQTFPMT